MLVNCAAYRDGRKIADIDKAAISDYVSQEDCFVWVALKNPTEGEIDEMGHEFDLHPLAIEDARHGHQRPKIDEYDGMLFCVMHTLESDEDGLLRSGEVCVFAGRNFVLSIRNRSEAGFQDVRKRCESDPLMLRHGAGFVLYALIDAVVDRYLPLIDRFDDEMEYLENRLFTARATTRSNIEDLYALKRDLTKVLHVVHPLQESVKKLCGGWTPGVCAGMQDYFRDVNDHLERIVRSLERIRDMLLTATQVNLTLVALDESVITKKLASWGALFAVPTMIAGIYGMNFAQMPELHMRYGYPVALLVMLVADLILWRRFRRSGWL
ncbi:magnesium/cobalt transporter CorA [Paludibacterium paludis]|uniref:Magnesium transport protein CorA n=1 Tax=Paludibacterium paludis TaxID=1225769 RepID=A0A918UBE0_9NEIS|nr:magnesium/cobalt transporter CorA [Paludibacterium paludis]GGY22391.1 magnesium transport protein CorA [Paludibacterium paludis]